MAAHHDVPAPLRQTEVHQRHFLWPGVAIRNCSLVPPPQLLLPSRFSYLWDVNAYFRAHSITHRREKITREARPIWTWNGNNTVTHFPAAVLNTTKIAGHSLLIWPNNIVITEGQKHGTIVKTKVSFVASTSNAFEVDAPDILTFDQVSNCNELSVDETGNFHLDSREITIFGTHFGGTANSGNDIRCTFYTYTLLEELQDVTSSETIWQNPVELKVTPPQLIAIPGTYWMQLSRPRVWRDDFGVEHTSLNSNFLEIQVIRRPTQSAAVGASISVPTGGTTSTPAESYFPQFSNQGQYGEVSSGWYSTHLNNYAPINMMQQDSDGRTLLHIAVLLHNRLLLAAVIKRATELGILEHIIVMKDSAGHTGLHWAVQMNDLDALYILLEAKGSEAALESTVFNGQTPLISAVIRENAECVKLLLEHGAKPEHRTEDGRAAIDFCTPENAEIMGLLRDFTPKTDGEPSQTNRLQPNSGRSSPANDFDELEAAEITSFLGEPEPKHQLSPKHSSSPDKETKEPDNLQKARKRRRTRSSVEETPTLTPRDAAAETTFSILIAGDSWSGKTSLGRQICEFFNASGPFYSSKGEIISEQRYRITIHGTPRVLAILEARGLQEAPDPQETLDSIEKFLDKQSSAFASRSSKKRSSATVAPNLVNVVLLCTGSHMQNRAFLELAKSASIFAPSTICFTKADTYTATELDVSIKLFEERLGSVVGHSLIGPKHGIGYAIADTSRKTLGGSTLADYRDPDSPFGNLELFQKLDKNMEPLIRESEERSLQRSREAVRNSSWWTWLKALIRHIVRGLFLAFMSLLVAIVAAFVLYLIFKPSRR